jgi:hypothetical protein
VVAVFVAAAVLRAVKIGSIVRKFLVQNRHFFKQNGQQGTKSTQSNKTDLCEWLSAFFFF